MFTYPADVDCGVLENDFAKANQLFHELGYELVEERDNDKFKHNIYKKNDLTVEIGTFDHDLGDDEAGI